MKLDFSKYKIKPEQTEIEAIEDKNRWLENNGYLTLDEVQKLTFKEKTKILQNTITLIEKYYKDNNIDLEVYPLNFEITSKREGAGKPPSDKFAENRTKNLIKDDVPNNKPNTVFYKEFFSHIKKEELYYTKVYSYIVDYGIMCKRYDDNNQTMKDLKLLIKNNDGLENHFSDELNNAIQFHKEVYKSQLAIYFCYFGANEENKEYYKEYYKLFETIFRTDIRKTEINTKLKNPYIFL